MNIPYAPNEFRDGYGQLVGFDVDLMNAIARVLGVAPEYREVDFDTILPSVQAGDFDVGMSSVTDTVERERLAVRHPTSRPARCGRSGPVRRSIPAHACGLRVGVTAGVIQQTHELPRKSDRCVAAGLPRSTAWCSSARTS